jgi:hypothetical protein
MTSVTVLLTPETEQQLRQQAGQRGQTLEAYLGELAEKEARGDSEATDMLQRGLDWLKRRSGRAVCTRAHPGRVSSSA